MKPARIDRALEVRILEQLVGGKSPAQVATAAAVTSRQVEDLISFAGWPDMDAVRATYAEMLDDLDAAPSSATTPGRRRPAGAGVPVAARRPAARPGHRP